MISTLSSIAASHAACVVVSKGVKSELLQSAVSGASKRLYMYLMGLDSHPELTRKLQTLDMVAQLHAVEVLLQDIENEENCGRFEGSLRVCIDQVQEVVLQIQAELDVINCEVETHRSRYFRDWRTPDFSAQLDNLGRLRDVLDRRFDMLVKILSIPIRQRSPQPSQHTPQDFNAGHLAYGAVAELSRNLPIAPTHAPKPAAAAAAAAIQLHN